MTNSEVAAESNPPEEDKTSTKNSPSTEISQAKRTTDSNCSPRKKPEIRAVVEDEKVLENNDPPKRITRRNKKKINLDDEEHTVEKKEPKAHQNRNKSLDDYDNWHLSMTSNETHVNKENQTKNVNKNKVLSPNHKLTEYFSDLRVNESLEDDVNNETNLNKKQIKDDQSTKETASLSSKQPSSDSSSQKTRRKLRQRKARLSIESTNHKVTEYFQVRRSERKYKKNILDERQRDLEKKIKGKVEDGLEITEIEGKGRGIVTTKEFRKGDFVVEYIGDLIDGTTARQREEKYARNKNIGCYMYYFKFNNTQYCIDATKESGLLGRLINHSRKGNLVSKIIEINQTPHLVLFAKTDIPTGIEILYDYGERNREAVQHHPWLTL